jgi:hypothetical protein
MDPKAWLQKARDELVELSPSAESDAADAWRTAVLIARLLGSPAGPVPPIELVRRLPQILAVAGSPDPQEMLDRVADQLDSESDPWGPLLDALLDVDDALGVLTLTAGNETSRALAQRVAGLVSLHPERVLALGSFAEMRLATVRDGAVAGVVWSAVERAPAHALAEALPVAAPSKPPLELASRRKPVVVEATSFYIPEELMLAAAESAPQEARELETDGSGRAWVEERNGRMRLEATGLNPGPLSAALVAERRSDGVKLRQLAVQLEVSGGTAYADLGPWAGAENALHRLIADLKASELRIRLTVSSG